MEILNKYGLLGVEVLRAFTPMDTGETASMWRYEIGNDDGRLTLSFHNDNINEDVNIAVILQHGHGTGTGGWVAGRDYINPALDIIMQGLSKELDKEVRAI